ncbi:MAG: bifunctional riboflavin kinase/FAD synthetase [Desulfobacteraceae bacterium]|nr:bifunctional riboflavin kinase/FAD synthetase [Desulfobacteraceae bacterium]
MKVIENINELTKPLKNSVITVGNFDGVHKGHQALFRQVIKKANKINGISIVITFDPHPLRALGKSGPPLITRRDQKIELIELAEVDYILCLTFTKEFAATPPKTFIHDFLIARLGMKAIIVGPDYLFGKNREGNISLLKKEGEKAGFSVIIPDWVNDSATGTERISSTKIRNLVMDGRVSDVPKYLGRYYQIRGKVIKGRNRGGSQLGFPTANIKLHDELCPKFGVYAVKVECTKGVFQGVANIGYSPTFDDHIFTIEVHILDDFASDIYDTRIRVNIIERLRDEKKFSNIKELSDQISKDIKKAKDILSNDYS